MKQYLLAGLFAAISATSVQAIENQKTVCSHGNQMRVIEVVYTSEDNVPCEVRYSKEEGTTTPWSANNLAGFCEEKAAAFVAKQQGWGWSCELAATAVSTDETDVSATPENVEETAPVETAPEDAAPVEASSTEPSTIEAVEPVAAAQ